MTKYYVDINGNYLGGFDGAAAPDGSIEVALPPNHGLDKWNGAAWVRPEKPLSEQAEAVRIALQSAIDEKAKSFGFSGGNALMLYAGFINPFQSLAQVFATWEATVWVEAEAYKAQVIAGNKPMLTGVEAIALMPVYPA